MCEAYEDILAIVFIAGFAAAAWATFETVIGFKK